MSYSFPPNLQNTFTFKTYKLGTWDFEWMSASLRVSHVTCHIWHIPWDMSHVKSIFFFSFGQRNEASRWRVFYQWGLPHLVLLWIIFKIIYHELYRRKHFELAAKFPFLWTRNVTERKVFFSVTLHYINIQDHR